MSFEERFAAAGRILDDMVRAMRDRLHITTRTRPSLDLRRAVAERLTIAQQHCQSAVVHARDRIRSDEHRATSRMVAIAILCIGTTAAITWFIAAPRASADRSAQPDWDAVSAIAATRDARAAGQGSPTPVRAGGQGPSPR